MRGYRRQYPYSLNRMLGGEEGGETCMCPVAERMANL